MPELKAEDFARLATLFVPETVTALAFSPDGSLLAIGSANNVHVFRVPAQAKPNTASPPAAALISTPTTT